MKFVFRFLKNLTKTFSQTLAFFIELISIFYIKSSFMKRSLSYLLIVVFQCIIFLNLYANESKHTTWAPKTTEMGDLLQGSKNAAAEKKLKNFSVLLYTKNGKGYVHDNIPSAISCIEQLGKENHFKVVSTEDPTIFNDKDLQQFTLVIFASTNNDVFDTDEQKLAFRHYIEAGGGFVGIHSVTGTERNWPWFKMMLGETFSWHAKFQSFSTVNLDPSHPSMKGIPMRWTKEDECYFGKELYPGMKVLMASELSTLNPDQTELIQKNAGSYANYFPLVWLQNFDGGHVWITTLGHDKKNYQEPLYKQHILNGIQYIAGEVGKLDYSKCYAKSKDDTLRF